MKKSLLLAVSLLFSLTTIFAQGLPFPNQSLQIKLIY